MKLTPVVNAIGVGGVLSAFGYAALRAHWNFLGVSVSGGVPAERYIAESWNIVAGSIPFLLLAALALLLLLLVVWGGAKWLAHVRPGTHERFAARAGRAVPLLVLIGLLAAQIAIWKAITADPICGTDVLLGDLAKKNAAGCYDVRGGHVVFLLALAMVAGAFVATRADALTRLQLFVRILAVAVALQLPTLYGYTIKPPLYRVVRAEAGGKVITAVLLLQTNSCMEVWDAVGGRGRMRIFPASPSMESGSTVDLLEAARTLAGDPRPDAFQRLCNEHLSPGGP
jgi:hypothetical protein